jgi:hypothetical protein
MFDIHFVLVLSVVRDVCIEENNPSLEYCRIALYLTALLEHSHLTTNKLAMQCHSEVPGPAGCTREVISSRGRQVSG